MKCVSVLLVICLLLVREGLEALEPKLYYFETECAKSIIDQTSSYIGVEEQVQILTTPNATYSPNMNCFFTLRAGPGDRFQIFFNGLEMEDRECAYDWVTFFDGDVLHRGFVGEIKYCGKNRPVEVLTSSRNEVTIYFQSNSAVQFKGFDIIVTVFHIGSCANFETECSNGRCIHSDLTCNGFNPCGDYSDCERSEGNYIGIIIGGSMSVFVIVVIVVTVIMFITCRRRRLLGIPGHVERLPQPPPIEMQPVTETSTDGKIETGEDTTESPPAYATINDINVEIGGHNRY